MASAPAEDDLFELPAPLAAPTFSVPEWNNDDEPLGITRLRGGETFFDGVERIVKRVGGGGPSPVLPMARTCLPGMRVAEGQIGVMLVNGGVRLVPPGSYPTVKLNPWKTYGAVIPIHRDAGVEFDPLQVASAHNRRLSGLQLGNGYRQIVLQVQQVGVFEDQDTTKLATGGTFIYSPDVEMRGVIDLNHMTPLVVSRETEDTATAASTGTTTNHHGRQVQDNRAHGMTVNTIVRRIPAGYVCSVAGITIVRPEKGFVVLHKDAQNRISMTEGICAASGKEDFVRRMKHEHQAQGTSLTMNDLEIEFGDLNHYAKSTPLLELKSRDNIDALCRIQIKWKQTRPDIWVTHRGAFTDPFDMLEEKAVNMMRDWLLSVQYADALEEKAKGFTKVEHQWSAELNGAGRKYGVQVLNIEITALRFPSIDIRDERMAEQRAETNLAVEMSRQNAMKEIETSKLNQAMHVRMQEDRDREAEAEERQQIVQRRKNAAAAETITNKANMDTKAVEAEMALALAQQDRDKKVALAKANAEAEADRVRALGKRDAAQLSAEGDIAATKEKNKAQLEFLKNQADLLKNNPGLLDLLTIQNDLLKTQALAAAAETNPNVVLLTGQEALEARRMNGGHAPQVPGSVLMTN